MKFTTPFLSSLALSTSASAYDSGIYARSEYDNTLHARALHDLVARHEDLLARNEDLSDHLYARDASWDEDFVLVARSAYPGGTQRVLTAAEQAYAAANSYQASQDAAASMRARLNTPHNFPVAKQGGSTSGGTVQGSKEKLSKFQQPEDFSKYKKDGSKR